jgi:hypothetical protein
MPRRREVCTAPSPRHRHRRIPSSASGCVPIVVTTECPEPLCPGRALPALGRPRRPPGGALPPRRRSYGLMRQTIPLPAPPVRPLRAGSSQVVASPCCEMALPDIISAILAWVLGPLPRRALRPHASATSPRTPASPQSRRVRRAKFPPHCSFMGTSISRLQSFDHLRAPTLARPPDCSHRSGNSPPSGQAVHTTHRPAGYPDRDVASLRARHGQLARLDSHQLDRSLVGCSPLLRCRALPSPSPCRFLPALSRIPATPQQAAIRQKRG